MTDTAIGITWPDWQNLRLSPWQKRFLWDDSLLKICAAGRGAGKSFVILLDALIAAMDLYLERREAAYWPRPGPMVIVGIVAPNLQNLHDLWAAAKTLVPHLPGNMPNGEKRFLVRENKKTIYLFGESRGIQIRLMSAWLPNSMRSASIDILVCDEWAFCGYSVKYRKTMEGVGKGGDEVYFTILEKLVIRSFCLGKITIASTPLSNYFDDWCDQAITGEGDFALWNFHRAHALDNIHLTEAQKAQIAEEKSRNEWKYAQEREAALHVVYPKHTATDLAWPSDLVDSILVKELPLPIKGPFAGAIDISWTGPNFLCVGIVDLNTNTIIHVEYHPKTKIDDIMGIMRRVHDRWRLKPKRLGYDATGEGKSVNKLLPDEWEAEPVYFWDKQKPHLVRNVLLRAKSGQLRILDPENFDFDRLPPEWNPEGQNQKENFAKIIAEIRDYRKVEDTLPNGDKRIRYFKGPVIGTDDGVDMLSVMGHVMPAVIDITQRTTKRKRLADGFRSASIA
jgi:hypothetical protein